MKNDELMQSSYLWKNTKVQYMQIFIGLNFPSDILSRNFVNSYWISMDFNFIIFLTQKKTNTMYYFLHKKIKNNGIKQWKSDT